MAVQNPVKIELKNRDITEPKVEKIAAPVSEKVFVQTGNIPVQSFPHSINNVSVYKGTESAIPKPKYDFSIKPIPAVVETNGQTLKIEAAKTAPLNAEDELIIEAVEIIEDEMVLPAEAVEIVAETSKW